MVGAVTTSTFVYDANGQRVVKTVAVSDGDTTATTRTLYMGTLYEERSSSRESGRQW